MPAAATIYGFISDTTFWKKQIVDLNKELDTGIGFLDDILINYFHQIGRISDPREERLDVIGTLPDGKISLLFDSSKMEPDIGPFFDIPERDVAVLFNIIEKILFTQNRTELELDRELEDDSDIPNYVPQSVRRSSKYTVVAVDSLRTDIKVYDFIEFDLLLNGHDIHFKWWLKSAAFADDYPLTTITAILAPCEPQYLLDPDTYKSPVEAVVRSADAIFEDVDVSTTGIDHTGNLGYKTRWVINSQNTQEVRFGVMYQGAMPSSLEVRAAIREYLKSLSIAPDAVWEARLPDLFVTAQFFLIPMWENITYRPDNKYGHVYPSIINHDLLINETYRILPTFDVKWLEDKTEVLTNPFNSILLTAISDPLNDLDRFSLRDILTTYQAFSPSDTNYNYQEANAKNFSRYLGIAMAILYGDEVPSTSAFTTNEFYGRRYLSFTSDQIEYHVLYREDYRKASEE